MAFVGRNLGFFLIVFSSIWTKPVYAQEADRLTTLSIKQMKLDGAHHGSDSWISYVLARCSSLFLISSWDLDDSQQHELANAYKSEAEKLYLYATKLAINNFDVHKTTKGMVPEYQSLFALGKLKTFSRFSHPVVKQDFNTCKKVSEVVDSGDRSALVKVFYD